MRSTASITALLATGAMLASGGDPLSGQTPDDAAARPIDRWLVAAVSAPDRGADPLSTGGVRLFPDRDIEVGPAKWTLVRDDGRARFALDEALPDRPAAAAGTLAHAYLRLPADATATLTVEAACPRPGIWLNGQILPDASAGTVVRLAEGWNTLLVALTGDGCAAELAARIAPANAPRLEDEPPLDTNLVRVQASRPPGARATYPIGLLQPGAPQATGAYWEAGADRLMIEVEHSLTAWGASSLEVATNASADRPTGPPTVDPTGTWSLRFFTPIGIRDVEARLEMAADGTLTGRLDGDGFDGDLRDGWVAGNEFGWVMRFPGPRRDADATARGRIEDGRMRGSLDLGVGDFETAFEGTPADETDTETTDEEEDAAAPPPGASRPPAGQRRGAGGRGDITFPGGGPPDRSTIVSRLLPPQPWRERPAPAAGSVELDVKGAKLAGGVEGLAPARRSTMRGRVEFDRARSAALEEGSVKAVVRWAGDDHDFRGQLDPDPLLRALHGPISLSGWSETPDGLEGRFRVPDALRGFSLRVLDGRWSVGGEPLEGDTLCAPCRGGERLELRVSETDAPRVEIVEPGYPSAAEDAPPARVWLEALRGNNDAYRRMGAQSAGSSSGEGSSSDDPDDGFDDEGAPSA